jgi:hypothetical protein
MRRLYGNSRHVYPGLLIGERDNLLSEADRKWAKDLDDVRVIDTDHFISFRHPEVVAQLVLGPTT